MPKSRRRARQDNRQRQAQEQANKRLNHIEPKSINQKKYFRSIRSNPYSFVIGPPGTGKTYIALWHGLKAVFDRNSPITKIAIVRPLVEVQNFDEKSLGALPGDAQQKMTPWMGGMMDALRDFVHEGEIKRLLAQNIIEFYNVALCRGRSFINTFVIIDETQNITVEGDGMKMLLTRLGKGSKMVIAGDLKQSDIRRDKASGLRDAIKKFYDVEGFGVTLLGPGDIVRNELISTILEAYGDYSPDERELDIWDILEE